MISFVEFSDPTYLASIKSDVDAQPLDGIIFTIPFTKPGTGETDIRLWNFSDYIIPWSLVEPQIEIYNNIQFEHVTHNFPILNTRPGNTNWFDDDWVHAVTENFGTAARLAKAMGLPGFMFDSEPYEGPVWNPPDLPSYPEHSFAEHCERVYEVAFQFGMKINAYYPNMKFFATQANLGFLGDITSILWSYFINGIVDAMSTTVPLYPINFLAGEENTYTSHDRAGFDYYDNILYNNWTHDANVSPNYLPQQSKAFSISPQGGGETWSHVDFNLNYMTPAVFQDLATYALELSTEYAWCYMRRLNWYTVEEFNNPIDAPYVLAMKVARLNNHMPVW